MVRKGSGVRVPVWAWGIARDMLHSGVSVYELREDARSVAQTLPKIGGWLAELDLRADDLVTFARCGHGSQLTVWAPPQVLLDAVISLSSVRE
jgi:hypothetical protein